MKILGIDPGLRHTGFGFIEKEGQHIRYLASGTIHTTDTTLSNRLNTIFTDITHLIAQFQPHCAAVEKVFVNVNPQSTLLLGHARGAAITALAHAHIDVFEYTALQVKQSVVGHGKAPKTQVQAMVQRLLHLSSKPNTDAADALGVAICHANSMHVLTALTNASSSHITKRGLRIRKGRLMG